MATADQEARSVFVQSPMDAISAARRPLFSAVRWGAIIAGVAAGVSVQLALTLLGIATGLSAADIAADNGRAAAGAMLWAGVSMLIAAYIGGYVAARMSGLKRKADGVLHGMVTWAVTTILFAVIAASAGGSLLGGIFNSMGPNVMQGNARIAADRSVESVSTTAWVLFATVALALAIGIAGGAVGAAGSRRTTWSSTPSAAGAA